MRLQEPRAVNERLLQYVGSACHLSDQLVYYEVPNNHQHREKISSDPYLEADLQSQMMCKEQANDKVQFLHF